MDDTPRRTQLLNRVREDADSLAKLINGGINVPLHQYVDRADIDTLCDSLSLDLDNWEVEDLERILLIRDGLYDLRNQLRDTSDDEEAEHSVERILSASDRLYADLERAFRELKKEDLEKAQALIAAYQRGPSIKSGAIPQTLKEVSDQAAEVMTHAHTSIRSIDVSLTKIDRTNADFEVLKNLKITVQRLGASVFAIRMSAQAKVVYQGVFQLLHDGADKIVEDLRGLLQRIRGSYDKGSEFLEDLGQLADKGTRFSRLVSDLLNDAFLNLDRKEETVVDLKILNTQKSEAIVCSAIDKDRAILVGRNGAAWTVDGRTGYIAARYRVAKHGVSAVAVVQQEDSGERYLAIGTDSGLEVTTLTGESDHFRSQLREKVNFIVTPPWGRAGSRGTIVTGSQNGIVRRWTLAEDRLSQMNEHSYEEVGRRVEALVVAGNQVVAATARNLVILDEQVNTVKAIPLSFGVSAMDLIGGHALILCGEGTLAHLTLDEGVVARILTASRTAAYNCVAAKDSKSFFFGRSDGRIGVMDLASGEELGSISVGFDLKNITAVGGKLIAYGGDWKKPNRSMAVVSIGTRTMKLETVRE